MSQLSNSKLPLSNLKLIKTAFEQTQDHWILKKYYSDKDWTKKITFAGVFLIELSLSYPMFIITGIQPVSWWHCLVPIFSGTYGGWLGTISARIVKKYMQDILGEDCVKKFDFEDRRWLLFSRSLPNTLKSQEAVEHLNSVFEIDHEKLSIPLSNHPFVAFVVLLLGLLIGAGFSQDSFWEGPWWLLTLMFLSLLLVFFLAAPEIFVGRKRRHLDFLSMVRRLSRLEDDAPVQPNSALQAPPSP